MAKRTTFFIVDRKLLEDPLWLAEPFTKGQAWLDLIGRASYEDGELTRRGELLVSERELARRWQWTRARVRWFLKKLETDGMIKRTRERTTPQPTQGTTLTVENYDKYQTAQPRERTTPQPTEQPVYNNIYNKQNISLYTPTGAEAEEIASLFGGRSEQLIEDVRSYYQRNPEKDFPGWLEAVKVFNSNQTRWSRTKRKKQKSIDEIIAEMTEEGAFD